MDWRQTLQTLRRQFEGEAPKHPRVYHAVLESRDKTGDAAIQEECDRWLRHGPPFPPQPTQMRLGGAPLTSHQSPSRARTQPKDGVAGLAMGVLFAPADDAEGVARLLTLAKAAGATAMATPEVVALPAVNDLRPADFKWHPADFWLLLVHRLGWHGVQPGIQSKRWMWYHTGDLTDWGEKRRAVLEYRSRDDLVGLAKGNKAYENMYKRPGDTFYAVLDLDMFTASALAIGALLAIRSPEESVQATNVSTVVQKHPALRLLGALGGLHVVSSNARLFRDLEERRERARRLQDGFARALQGTDPEAAMREAQRPPPSNEPEHYHAALREILGNGLMWCREAEGALRAGAGEVLNEALTPGTAGYSVGLAEKIDEAHLVFIGLGPVVGDERSLVGDRADKMERLCEEFRSEQRRLKAVVEQRGLDVGPAKKSKRPRRSGKLARKGGQVTDRAESTAALARLAERTPALNTDDGTWLPSKVAAKLDSLKTRTLATYRGKGLSSQDQRFGQDADGRVWRRTGTPTAHPWYWKKSLVSQRGGDERHVRKKA